jgi:fluoroquinolone resistance protein
MSEYYENDVIKLDKYSSTEFVNCDFKSLDLSEMSLKYSKFIECGFEKCNISNASLIGSTFRDVTFKNCKLLGLNWSDTVSTFELGFSDSLLDFNIFEELDLRGMIAKNCSLKEVEFAQCKLQKSDFTNSNFEGSNFRECDLSNSCFREAKSYYIDPEFNVIVNAKFSMPEAMIFFDSLKIKVE